MLKKDNCFDVVVFPDNFGEVVKIDFFLQVLTVLGFIFDGNNSINGIVFYVVWGRLTGIAMDEDGIAFFFVASLNYLDLSAADIEAISLFCSVPAKPQK